MGKKSHYIQRKSRLQLLLGGVYLCHKKSVMHKKARIVLITIRISLILGNFQPFDNSSTLIIKENVVALIKNKSVHKE